MQQDNVIIYGRLKKKYNYDRFQNYDTNNCGHLCLKFLYSEFFLRLAIGFYMLIFQPPVNFCSDENIQIIFGTKLEDCLNYRLDYNSIF
jgi:hypothetical protein